MKTRKVMTHNLLVEAVIREAQSRFVPSISAIKKCIEGAPSSAAQRTRSAAHATDAVRRSGAVGEPPPPAPQT